MLRILTLIFVFSSFLLRAQYTGKVLASHEIPPAKYKLAGPGNDHLGMVGRSAIAYGREAIGVDLVMDNLHATPGRKFVQVVTANVGFALGMGITVLMGSQAFDVLSTGNRADIALTLAAGHFMSAAMVCIVGNSDERGRFFPTLGGALTGTLISTAITAASALIAEESAGIVACIAYPLFIGGMATRGYNKW